MKTILIAWYFAVTVISFGGPNPPSVIGPFTTAEDCERVRKAMTNTNSRTSPCWEGS